MMKCNACIDAKTGIALEGEALEAALKDPNAPRCGYELKPDDVFCPSCGANAATIQQQGTSVSPQKHWYSLKGRSARKEFWMTILFTICNSVFWTVCSFTLMEEPTRYCYVLGLIYRVWVLICGFATIAVSVRRLHDLNNSGWLLAASPLFSASAVLNPYIFGMYMKGDMLILIILFPLLAAFVFSLVLFVLMGFKPGTKGPNKYGPDPLVGKNATTGHTVLDGNL